MQKAISYKFSTIFNFFVRQVEQVKKEGVPVLGQKIKKAILKCLLLLPALFCIAVIKILKPFIIVRFGPIDMWRIGCIYNADWYLSERSVGMHGKKYFDIFYFFVNYKIICNQQWLKMWKRVLPVFSFWKLAGMVDRIFRNTLKDESHAIPMCNILVSKDEPINKYNDKLKIILANKEPHISFTKEEEDFGQKALKEMGIPEKKSFICFHSRDSAYLDTLNPEQTWNYHDYRDSSIHNYVPAAEEFARRGYYLVRMGAVVKEKLDAGRLSPSIIDYATNGVRTDFLDIYLSVNCKFFICSDTGMSVISEMFRRPVVYTNWTIIRKISPWVINGLFIFKKFYLKEEKRLMTFREMMDISPYGRETEYLFDQKGIELIENTPEEILAASQEMEQRLDKTWQSSQEDEGLQRHYWNLYGSGKTKSPNVRIGAQFLRENKELLD